MLSAKETELSNIDEAFYVTIKSDQQLLEEFFKGLFVAARTFLGFDVRSSNILITRKFTPNQLRTRKSFRTELEYAKNISVIATPETKKFGKNTCATVAISLSKKLLEKALSVLNSLSNEIYYLHDHRAPINYCALSSALVEDYWTDMLKYAQTNSDYSTNWQ